MSRFQPATRPTLYFIGVTTGKSSIMKVFPAWAEFLGLKDAEIKGIDFALHDDPAAYRRPSSSFGTTRCPWARSSPPIRSTCSMPAAISSTWSIRMRG